MSAGHPRSFQNGLRCRRVIEARYVRRDRAIEQGYILRKVTDVPR
jgi:hypothetical protein